MRRAGQAGEHYQLGDEGYGLPPGPALPHAAVDVLEEWVGPRWSGVCRAALLLRGTTVRPGGQGGGGGLANSHKLIGKN